MSPIKKNKKAIAQNMQQPLLITPQVEKTMQSRGRHDPIARQYIPAPEEEIQLQIESLDPIGDEANSPIEGLVHRHAERVLLKITDICAVYCRFCFRKDMVGQGKGVLAPKNLDAIYSYIQNHPEIREVIFTGGDPLTLSNRRLSEILGRLSSIRHLDIIRFHTRTPIVQPERIDDEFIKILNQIPQAVYVVLHVNHVQEIDATIETMLKKFMRCKATILSQSVLLKGVNDNEKALEDLFRTLVRLNVKPYYLHHPDKAAGTSHFQVPIAHGQKLMRHLRRTLSGLCLPSYVLDIPGGYGKIPLESSYITQGSSGSYVLEDYQGRPHIYVE